MKKINLKKQLTNKWKYDNIIIEEGVIIMNFMEIKDLYSLGYEPNNNKNVFQGMEDIELANDIDLKINVENMLKAIAYDLHSDFYYSMVFYDNEHAYSVVKIDGDIYEKHFESKEAIESAMEHSYECDDVAIFKLKDDILECIGY